MTIPRNPSSGPSGGDAANRGAKEVRAPRFTLKPSKQTAIILGAAMGLVVFGCVGLYVWQSAELGEIQKQVSEKEEELASGQKIASKLETVRADYISTQNQLRYLETSVTEDEYVPSLLHQVEALAKSVNMQVDSIRPTLEPSAAKAAPVKKDPNAPADDKSKAPPPPPYDKLHIDMQMKGNYWDTAKLLYKLTEFQKIIAVESLELHPVSSPLGGVSPVLGVHLNLTGFIFPNDGKNGVPGVPSTGPGAAPGAAVAAPGAPAQPAPGAAQAPPQQRAMMTRTVPAPALFGA